MVANLKQQQRLQEAYLEVNLLRLKQLQHLQEEYLEAYQLNLLLSLNKLAFLGKHQSFKPHLEQIQQIQVNICLEKHYLMQLQLQLHYKEL